MTESDEDVVTQSKAIQRRLETQDRKIGELHERIDHIQFVLDALVTNLPTQTLSKREKKYRILSRAVRDASDHAVATTLTREKVAGVADCSDRHARNLMGELDEAYPWAEYISSPEAKLIIEFPGGDVDSFRRLVDGSLFPEVDT